MSASLNRTLLSATERNFRSRITQLSSGQWFLRGTLSELSLIHISIVHPGDVIVADTDGVVVVQRREAAEVVRLSEERLAKEARNREQLKAGKLGLDIYGLRAKLKALGVDYVDRAPE